MARSRRVSIRIRGECVGRRGQRVKILTTLVSICAKIERLQASGEARLACREVAGLLTAVRAQEQALGELRRR